MGKTLLEATVKDIKKCRYPSKYYVSGGSEWRVAVVLIASGDIAM